MWSNHLAWRRENNVDTLLQARLRKREHTRAAVTVVLCSGTVGALATAQVESGPQRILRPKWVLRRTSTLRSATPS
jgi:hypothetical protein